MNTKTATIIVGEFDNNEEIKVGMVVALPLNEIGVVDSINTKGLDWFPIKVKIYAAALNQQGEVTAFKREQLGLICSLK